MIKRSRASVAILIFCCNFNIIFCDSSSSSSPDNSNSNSLNNSKSPISSESHSNSPNYSNKNNVIYHNYKVFSEKEKNKNPGENSSNKTELNVFKISRKEAPPVAVVSLLDAFKTLKNSVYKYIGWNGNGNGNGKEENNRLFTDWILSSPPTAPAAGLFSGLTTSWTWTETAMMPIMIMTFCVMVMDIIMRIFPIFTTTAAVAPAPQMMPTMPSGPNFEFSGMAPIGPGFGWLKRSSHQDPEKIKKAKKDALKKEKILEVFPKLSDDSVDKIINSVDTPFKYKSMSRKYDSHSNWNYYK